MAYDAKLGALYIIPNVMKLKARVVRCSVVAWLLPLVSRSGVLLTPELDMSHSKHCSCCHTLQFPSSVIWNALPADHSENNFHTLLRCLAHERNTKGRKSSLLLCEQFQVALNHWQETRLVVKCSTVGRAAPQLQKSVSKGT